MCSSDLSCFPVTIRGRREEEEKRRRGEEEKKIGEEENYSTYFIKIDKVKFKRKVIPGDQIIFKIELMEPIRRGIVHMQGYGYVGDNVVVEAELMAQIAKTKE